MSAGYLISLDPSKVSGSFPSPEQDPIDPNDEIEADAAIEEVESLLSGGMSYEDRIVPLLDRIPPREADLIYLYFVQKKKQADIALIFNVTQAAISYRLDRGLQRIKFLLSIPVIHEEDMRADLASIFKPIDIDILVGMWQTTCQSEVAHQLGRTQGQVRHRFFKAVATLEEASKLEARYVPYYQVFLSISSKNFNILRSVELPQWSDRGRDECL